MANIYTKGGDKGQTSLIGGSRVSKGDLRVECYGTIDEFVSALGLAYALSEHGYTRRMIRAIQDKLFVYSAELAADEAGLKKLAGKLITEADVLWLEKMIDCCTMVNGFQKCFVVPGEDRCSAALHVARTVARRAERYIIRLDAVEPLRDVAKKYINRLSDASYALARLEETLHQLDFEQAKIINAVLEVTWEQEL